MKTTTKQLFTLVDEDLHHHLSILDVISGAVELQQYHEITQQYNCN